MQENIINKSEEKNIVFNKIIDDLLKKQELIIIKDNYDLELLNIVKSKISDIEEIMIVDNLKTHYNFLIDIQNILLKNKIKILYFKEDYKNKSLFNDIKVYIGEKHKNMNHFNLIFNNYPKEDTDLKEIIDNSSNRNFNVINIIKNYV